MQVQRIFGAMVTQSAKKCSTCKAPVPCCSEHFQSVGTENCAGGKSMIFFFFYWTNSVDSIPEVVWSSYLIVRAQCDWLWKLEDTLNLFLGESLHMTWANWRIELTAFWINLCWIIENGEHHHWHIQRGCPVMPASQQPEKKLRAVKYFEGSLETRFMQDYYCVFPNSPH